MLGAAVNPSDFLSPEAGRVVRLPQGYAAFVPAPLPPTIKYDEDLIRGLSRADAALGELSGLGRLLPDPHLLIAPYVRREAVFSSRIEGTRTSLSDLLLDEVGAGGGAQTAADKADRREVRNYVSALEYGIQRLETLPLSQRLVREIHERLMSGVRGGHATPGEFRRSQNWIGPPGSTPETAPYVPPPTGPMADLLADWEVFLHVRGEMPDLVQCAVMHEQFEAIHPFLDSNGRVGRLLITLFLVERGRLAQPLLYISDYLEAHRQDYYDLLQRVRTRGDWPSWLRFFLAGVEATSTAAARQTRYLIDLREAYRSKLDGKPRALALLDALLVNPYLTAGRAAETLGVSLPTARAAIAALVDAGLLEEVSGRAWRRLYLARPILSAIDPAR
jgi:Fic family protein